MSSRGPFEIESHDSRRSSDLSSVRTSCDVVRMERKGIRLVHVARNDSRPTARGTGLPLMHTRQRSPRSATAPAIPRIEAGAASF